MEMLYRSINFTEITYNVLDAPQLRTKTILVPRKLSLLMARRMIRKAEGDSLIQQTLTIRVYRQLYRMPIKRFLEIAERVPTGKSAEETTAPM